MMRHSKKGQMVNHTYNQVTGVDFRDTIQKQGESFSVEAAQEFAMNPQQLQALKNKMKQ